MYTVCVSVIPQCSNHLNKTLYKGFLRSVNMHDIICVRAVPELCPFYKKYIHIENVCIYMF